MSSDHKGVEPSLEEILASIRRIIADSASPTPNTFADSYAQPPLNTDARIDHDDAFDLPAMFRSSHSLADPLPPQIGAANLEGHRIDWQHQPARRGNEKAEEPSQHPHPDLGQGGHAHESEAAAELPSVASARTANATGSDEPSLAGGSPSPPRSSSPPPLPFSQPSMATDVPRQMVACRDTLVAGRMGQSHTEVRADVATGDVPRPRIPADGLGYGPIIPAEFRAPGAQPSAAKTGGSTEPQGEAGPDHFTPMIEGFIDQTAVALMRPLLKQWLDSNMRSVFEKALHVEAESAKNRQQ